MMVEIQLTLYPIIREAEAEAQAAQAVQEPRKMAAEEMAQQLPL
jgi:hypothetical protein